MDAVALSIEEKTVPKRISRIPNDIFSKACIFYMSTLFADVKRRGTCSINITFGQTSDQALGETIHTDEDTVDIMLSANQSIRSIFITAAHEMVHAKQYLSGELADSRKSIHYSIWKGKQIHIRALNYYDLPWEIDALGREYGLYRRFVEKYKIGHIHRWASVRL